MAITNKTILIIRDKNLACIPQQPCRPLPWSAKNPPKRQLSTCHNCKKVIVSQGPSNCLRYQQSNRRNLFKCSHIQYIHVFNYSDRLDREH